MKAIAITPGVGAAELIDVEEPAIMSPTQVKLKVLEVGICGTDREEVLGGRADAPPNSSKLVIGHEMLGQVVDVGANVTKVARGDYAVFTVRRGCGKCEPCLNDRADMCYTGNYEERGIKARHGFETQFVVDDEAFLVKVPAAAKSIGVLAEPMSIVQKAVNESIRIQSTRLPLDESWINGATAVVAGIGAIGMLAVIALRLRGVKVIGMDIVADDSKRAQLLKQLGGRYINTKKVDLEQLDDTLGQIDFIFESAGVAQLGFDLIDVLGTNGIYVMTGIPHEGKPICFPAAEAMAQMVLKNQVILGSVNASTQHFEMGIADLEKAKKQWGDLIDGLITTRVSYFEFETALDRRSEDDIKTVITWE